AGMLRLRGLMAVAPPDEDPVRAFARLAAVAASFTRDHPEATWLSAGMSGDLEAAIGAGATHVRVGSAILGARPTIQ
ncbi:MAG: YggS family pyridoxal phosphate-dependent enzyme, partial [Nocardioides sp.]